MNVAAILNELMSHGLAWRAGWALVHFAWQGFAVAVLLSAALWLLRKRSANARYLAGCAAMLLLVILPVATAWYVSPPPVAFDAPEQAIAAVSPYQPFEMPVETAVLPTEPVEAGPVAPTQVPLFQRARDAIEPVLPHLLAGWLAGVVLLSLWRGAGWIGIRRLKTVGVAPAGADVAAVFAALARRMGVSRPVRVLKSSLATVPAVIGWLRPVVLVPAAALAELSPQQLQAILAHELAHVRRWDYLVNLAQTVVETLGFYHPAVWWVSSRIRAERENCCDDAATAACGDQLTYAQSLAALEQLRCAPPALAVAATGGSLLARIKRLLGTPTEGPTGSSKPFVAAIVLAAVAAGFCFGLRPAGGAASGDSSTRPADGVMATSKPHAEQAPLVEIRASFIEVAYGQDPAFRSWLKENVGSSFQASGAYGKFLDETQTSQLLATFKDIPEARVLSRTITLVRSGKQGQVNVGHQVPVKLPIAGQPGKTRLGYMDQGVRLDVEPTVGDDREHILLRLRASVEGWDPIGAAFVERAQAEIDHTATVPASKGVLLRLKPAPRRHLVAWKETLNPNTGKRIWEVATEPAKNQRAPSKVNYLLVTPKITVNQEGRTAKAPTSRPGEEAEARRVAQALQPTAKAETPQDGGEPYRFGQVVEGVACKLRPNKQAWPEGEEISFLVDTQNYGQRKFHLFADQWNVLVEVDGRWFRRTTSGQIKWQDTTFASFSPGQKYLSIPLILDEHWRELTSDELAGLRGPGELRGSPTGDRLRWSAGYHSVRVMMFAWPRGALGGRGPKPTRFVSLPVDIRILSPNMRTRKALREQAVAEANKVAGKWMEAWRARKWADAWALMLPSKTRGKTVEQAWLGPKASVAIESQRNDCSEVVSVTQFPRSLRPTWGPLPGRYTISPMFLLRLRLPSGSGENWMMRILLALEGGKWCVESWLLEPIARPAQKGRRVVARLPDGTVTTGYIGTRPERFTKVYDIRDLIVNVPDFTMPPSVVPASQADEKANEQEDKQQKETHRKRLTDAVIKLIEETVEPDSWKAGPGYIRHLKGQLVITQTVAAHDRIGKLIDQLRRKRALQVSVQARFISVAREHEQDLRKWLEEKLGSDFQADGLFGKFLDSADVDLLIEQAQAHYSTRALTAPRLTLFSGQKAHVTVHTVQPATLPVVGQPGRREGVRLSSGTSLQITATVSEDRKRTVTEMHPSITEYDVPKNGQPVSLVETEWEQTVTTPDGKTILLRLEPVAMKVVGVTEAVDPDTGKKGLEVVKQRVADAPASETITYVLVKQTILTAVEVMEPSEAPTLIPK